MPLEHLLQQPIVVDWEWIRDHLSDPNIALVDVRQPFFYSQGHIPGARSLPAFFLASPQGAAPDPDALARRLGSIGIKRESYVVAYDDGGTPAAARLFWVLDMIGHPAISVLDGGVTRWAHNGMEIETGTISPVAVEYQLTGEGRQALATAGDVLQAVESGQSFLLDVRSPGEYLGLEHSAAQDGHIPGAVNIDWSNALAVEDGTVGLKPDAELRTLYESAGLTDDKDVIVYCQSGHRSSHTYMVLRKLGFERVRNYDGGWQEWGNAGSLPVEK